MQSLRECIAMAASLLGVLSMTITNIDMYT